MAQYSHNNTSLRTRFKVTSSVNANLREATTFFQESLGNGQLFTYCSLLQREASDAYTLAAFLSWKGVRVKKKKSIHYVFRRQIKYAKRQNEENHSPNLNDVLRYGCVSDVLTMVIY